MISSCESKIGSALLVPNHGLPRKAKATRKRPPCPSPAMSVHVRA